jgi:hypothetical protein
MRRRFYTIEITHFGISGNLTSLRVYAEQSDTLVMQNLGYFQLQANPGLWRLNLASGRAQELFTIANGDSSLGE